MENLTNFESVCALLAVVAFCVAFVIVIFICAKYSYKADKEKNYHIQRIADSLEHIQKTFEHIDDTLLLIEYHQDEFFAVSVNQLQDVVDAIEGTCDGVIK